MKFTRLRLSGFKSFVEPTELHVEPGLTAVVGPNGCGKSNLFDALRWVMGETRPSSLRGGEMDDVIFAGSGGRPARNMAEVTLFVDNADRTATGAYNEYDSIEISRRIEREAGSVYRINGRDVRQRDVQLFFADASSGAGSTAFVRQGQIGLLISQKPLARRAILEEAAGIAGLHQRRHEAELRLRAAETNMGRLDDVIREVEGQLASLKRQARQASRYRNLSGHIRKAEALAHHLRWTAAELRLRAAEEELAAAAAAVESCTVHAAEASTIQANAASEVPPLREAEAERNAALHRLTIAREQLDQEEARAREAAQRLRQRIGQTQQDIERERTLDSDAQAALGALAAEAETLEAAMARSADEIAEADALAASLNEALGEAERTLERLTSELADWNARKASAERSRELALRARRKQRDAAWPGQGPSRPRLAGCLAGARRGRRRSRGRAGPRPRGRRPPHRRRGARSPRRRPARRDRISPAARRSRTRMAAPLRRGQGARRSLASARPGPLPAAGRRGACPAGLRSRARRDARRRSPGAARRSLAASLARPRRL
ncbi:MAG: AAA family ATPase [Rhizomicrobium sp.]